MRKALLLLAVIFICGCAGPSLRSKNDINNLIYTQEYDRAEKQLEKTKKKFGEKNAVMYYLNLGLIQHDAQRPADSNQSFDIAQDYMDALFTRSISRSAGRFLINDNTTPYYAPPYEVALSFYYRAMAYLDMNNLQDALVEARKAVYYLDNLRESKKKGYRDDAFVQYFASLLFESEGNISSARIARTNAFNAYGAAQPHFTVPKNADNLGEIIFIHYSGITPAKYSKTMQFSWGEALVAINETDELYDSSPTVQNAVLGGFAGNSVTLAYPALRDVVYEINNSSVEAAGIKQDTLLVSNISALVHEELEETLAAQRARMIARAALKQVAAQMAKEAARQASGDDNIGMLAGMIMSVFNAATEVADTRNWFTLPAEIRMTRLFVPEGKHTVYFIAKDANNIILESKEFKDIDVKKGERIFLHTRTTK